MHYALVFSGAPGFINGTLSFNGETIASESGLKDGEAARKWARKVARDHKVSNTPPASHSETTIVKGNSTFSV